MMKIEIEAPYPTVTITPNSQESIGMAIGTTAWTATTYPGSSRAIFIPFTILRPITVYKMFVYNGATVSGNVDVGIYDFTRSRLWSSGSTPQAGASQLQWFTLGCC